MAQYNGGSGDDFLYGSPQDDTFYSGGGYDTLDGQGGLDTVVLSGARADYDVAVVSAGGLTDYFLYDQRSGRPDGYIETRNIEQFQFSDGTLTAAALHATPYPGATIGAPNLIANGDFALKSATTLSIDYISENNVLPNTIAFGSADPYGSLQDWHLDGAFYITALLPQRNDLLSTTASDPRVNVGFFGDSTLSQTTNGLVSGRTYDLSFLAGGGPGGMEVTWDGVLVASQLNSRSTTHLTVTAHGGDSLSFHWVGQGGGLGNVSDVRLTVPGPAATADFSSETVGVIANLSDDPYALSPTSEVGALHAYSHTGGSQALDNVHTALGGLGADLLIGSSASDTLYGGAGNDTLYGGAGAGQLVGGGGDDTYYVFNAKDLVVEGAGGGSDVVHTTLASYVLPANVEALHYDGAGAFLATGSAGRDALYADRANAATLHGGAGDDTLYGGGGADSLYGDGGRDVIYGGAGNDYIRSLTGEGPDTISGGAGLDLLTLERTDAAQSLRVDLTLAGFQAVGEGTVFQQIEQIRFAGGSGADYARGGAYDDVLKGNGGADTLIGGDGNDVLQGGLGHDSLTGGAGADTFRFDGPTVGADDDVTDFATGIDKIALSATGFGVASLSAFDIVDAGAGPFEQKATLLVDMVNHTIGWDADGSGTGSAVLLAHGAFTTAPGDYVLF